MSTKNIFCPTYRKDYFQGYSFGLNPLAELISNKDNEAFTDGFYSGRMDYEEMNGIINNGIPEKIVTKKKLEDFLLAGLLGLKVNIDNYTTYQIDIISRWYQSGVEKYDPTESTYLFDILEENGILLSC